MLRFLRIAAQIIAALIGVVIVLAFILIWRLNAAPIRTEFFTPSIIAAIDKTLPGSHTEIKGALLSWDNADRSVSFHADGISITDAKGNMIAQLPSAGVKLSAIGLVLGQFLPTELVVDHLQLWLDRKPDGAFYFGDVTSTAGPSTNFRGALQRIADNLTHAIITHRLYVSRLVVNVHDEATKSDWAVNVPEIKLRREGINLAGEAHLEVTQKDHVSPITIRYEYERLRGLHYLSAQFSAITPAFFAGGKPGTLGLDIASAFNLPLTGDLQIAVDDDLNIETVNAQLRGDAGTLTYPDFWDAPRTVKSINIKAVYDRKDEELNVQPCVIDFGGPKLDLTLSGSSPSDTKHDLDIVLTAKLDNWPMDQYAALWPKPVIADARDWITGNLSRGNFDHGEGVFKGALAWNDLGNILLNEGEGKVVASNASVHYMDGMPPVENVNATALFDLNQMTVNIAGGGISDLKLMPFKLKIDGLATDLQTINIPLQITGPLPDILKLIDAPPLGYAKAVGLSPSDIGGKADATVSFKFPLLKTLAMKDVAIEVNANLTDLTSTKLIKGMDISQGSLLLTLDKSGFDLKGTAALNKAPLNIAWRQNFQTDNGKPISTAQVTGTVQGEQWPLLGFDALAGSKGPTNVSIDFTQQDKANATIAGTLDMKDADIRVDQLNWKKAAGTPATLKFAAAIPEGGNVKITSIDLEGPQLDIKGKAETAANDGGLLSLDLKPLIVGRTNATVHFIRLKGDNGTTRLEASGTALDISGLRGGKEPEHATPQPKEYHLKVGELYTSDTGFISDAEGFAVRDMEGWSAIKLHGKAQGAHELSIELTPGEEASSFSAKCDDFGAALHGLGFTDTVRDGGSVSIEGASTPDRPHTIEGKIDIGHFTVHDLPVLVFLLNATAPFNITNLVNNTATFDHMRGSFRWEGDAIQLKGVNASGSAIGLNIGGKVDMDTGAAKLSGTIVPFSMVNRVIDYIPIIGDLITGGKGGGVLAVAYTIGGTLDDPKIGVNPVSLLTPGFIRNLFFGSDNDYEDTDTPEKKKAP